MKLNDIIGLFTSLFGTAFTVIQEFGRKNYDYHVTTSNGNFNDNKFDLSLKEFKKQRIQRIVGLLILFAILSVIFWLYSPKSTAEEIADNIMGIFKIEKVDMHETDSSTIFSGDDVIIDFYEITAYYERYDGDKWVRSNETFSRPFLLYDIELWKINDVGEDLLIDDIEKSYNNEQVVIKNVETGRYILKTFFNSYDNWYDYNFDVVEKTDNNVKQTKDFSKELFNGDYIPKILYIYNQDNVPLSNKEITIFSEDNSLSIHTNNKGYTTFFYSKPDTIFIINVETTDGTKTQSFSVNLDNNVIIPINIY